MPRACAPGLDGGLKKEKALAITTQTSSLRDTAAWRALDYLSVGDAEAHKALLESGVVAVEGLDLRGIEPGPYELICLPLRLEGSDGAPARTILVG
jgi:kynurenine formamidase